MNRRTEFALAPREGDIRSLNVEGEVDQVQNPNR